MGRFSCVARSTIVLILLLRTSTILAQPIPRIPAPQSVGPAAAPGEIVVGFDTTLQQVSPQAATALAGATTIRSFPQIGAKLMRIAEAEVGPTCASLAQMEGIRYAEPNYRRRVLLAAPNDPAYNNLDTLIADWDGYPTWFQWNLHVVDALEAWTVWPNTYYTSGTKPANPVKVAVIDTGIDAGLTPEGIPHPDFINAGGSSPDAAFGGQIDFADARNVRSDYAPTNWADDFGHGTAVAGVIGAATNNGGVGQGDGIAGLAYNCQIMPIKAFDGTGNGSEADLVAGILWAVDHGAVVINISAGDYYYSQAEQDAVDYAWEHGSLIVAAAGNDGDSTLVYPAACTGVMSVAATMWEPLDTPASYSNHGEHVLVSAPAGDYSIDPFGFWYTWTTMPTELVDMHYAGYPGLGQCDYEYQAGTSLSSPFVAGLAALYAGSQGITQSTPDGVWQMWRAILKGCDNVSGGSGWDPYWGWGRINAYETMMDNNNRGATVGRISGQVKYYGTVTENAAVTATPAGGGSSISVTTHSDGMYRFSNLPPGLYDITSSYFGHSVTIEDVTVEAGVDRPRIYLSIQDYTAPTVTSITPNSAETNASVNITDLAGTGFLSGATVKLEKAGETDITATDVTVVSPTQITCTFDLTGAASGTWDVLVTNTDTTSARLVDGFTITADTSSPEITEPGVPGTHGSGVGEVVVSIVADYAEPRNCGVAGLRLGFSEPLDPATVNNGVVSIVGVLNGDCSPQVATVTLEGDDTLNVELATQLPDQDTYEVTVSTSVQDVVGNPVSADSNVVLSALKGDMNADKRVTNTDIAAVRAHVNEPITPLTAQYDMNMDGRITTADMGAVQANLGHTAPEPEGEGGGETSALGVGWCTLAVLATDDGGAEIVFSLGSEAAVDVTILNIAGRVVRRLVATQISPSGVNRLHWDGRSSRGTKVPAGLYLVELSARHEDGRQTRRISPASLNR